MTITSEGDFEISPKEIAEEINLFKGKKTFRLYSDSVRTILACIFKATVLTACSFSTCARWRGYKRRVVFACKQKKF